MTIEITAKEFYMTIVGTGVLLAALQFFLATWIKARVEQSVKHEYDCLLEEYRCDMRIRERASEVAHFIAYCDGGKLSKEEFNEIAWKLSLWLPTEIYIQLAKLMCGDKDSKSAKDILIDIRKLLLKEKAGNLMANNILHSNRPG